MDCSVAKQFLQITLLNVGAKLCLTPSLGAKSLARDFMCIIWMVEVTQTLSTNEMGREKECYIFNLVFCLVQTLRFGPSFLLFLCFLCVFWDVSKVQYP